MCSLLSSHIVKTKFSGSSHWNQNLCDQKSFPDRNSFLFSSSTRIVSPCYKNFDITLFYNTLGKHKLVTAVNLPKESSACSKLQSTRIKPHFTALTFQFWRGFRVSLFVALTVHLFFRATKESERAWTVKKCQLWQWRAWTVIWIKRARRRKRKKLSFLVRPLRRLLLIRP